MGEAELTSNLEISDILAEYCPLKKLDNYFNALMSENQAVNLVSRETKREDFDRLAADSILPLRIIKSPINSYLDIGSGGGFPAIPLLLARPTVKSTVLVERTEKKAAALKRIIDSLGIEAQILGRTFEEITLKETKETFDLITMRYVKLTPSLLKKIISRLSQSGIFIYYSKLNFEIDGSESFSYSFEGDSIARSFTIFKKNC